MLSKRGFKSDLIMLNHIFSIFRQRSASIFGFARNFSMLCCVVSKNDDNGEIPEQGSGNKKLIKGNNQKFHKKINYSHWSTVCAHGETCFERHL